MKEILLTQGKRAIVDNEDFTRFGHLRWYAQRKASSRTFYASRALPGGGTTTLHEEILGVSGVDHRDGDGLNNRRANLRRASPLQNMWNRRKHKPGSSRFKGVIWEKGAWRARITVKGRLRHLGRFVSETEAAFAYDSEAKKHFGEFARLNFV